MVIIIDYGMGNLGSIQNMIKKIGGQALVSSKEEEIDGAHKLILPGVGAFDKGISCLENLNLVSTLHRKVFQQKTPILGICLGMQLFTKKSEEGKLDGLGWIDGETMRFKFDSAQNHLKIPHMGWNTARIRHDSKLMKDLGEEPQFYFAHSYHVVCQNPRDPLLTTQYGYEFASAVERENIYGVQFHPEKSHRFGMRLFKNFLELGN